MADSSPNFAIGFTASGHMLTTPERVSDNVENPAEGILPKVLSFEIAKTVDNK